MTYASGKRSPVSRLDGLTFIQATDHAKRGELIRREVWENTLRDRKGVLEFTTAVHVYGKVADRSYEPTEIDRNARDWVIA